jgi:hypothetical protein
MPTSFAHSLSLLDATRDSRFRTYGHPNDKPVTTIFAISSSMAFTSPPRNTAYLFTAAATLRTMASPTASTSSLTYRVAQNLPPTETTVCLTDTNTLHTIFHNTDTRLNIAWFSKTWCEAERKRAPFYLEADTLLWGLAKCRFWALSSPFPLYASSDHLPLKWVRKCEKGPVSEFTIEQLIVRYTMGPLLHPWPRKLPF